MRVHHFQMALIARLWSLCGHLASASFIAAKKDLMNGVVLKTSAFDYPPIFTVRKLAGGDYAYEGIGPEMVQMFGAYYNMTIIYVHADPKIVAKYGTIRTLQLQMDERAVDVVFHVFETTLENIAHMDISFPITVQGFALLQPWPQEKSRLKAPIRPFDAAVWYCIGVIVIAFIVATSAMRYVQRYIKNDLTTSLAYHRNTMERIVYQQLEYVAKIVTFQGDHVSYTTSTYFRIAVAFWLLPTMVILFAYCGVLTSLLTVPKFEPTIDTFDDVIKTSDLRITIEADFFVLKQFMSATTGTYKQIGDMLRRNYQDLVYNDHLQMLDNVLRSRCVCPMNIDMVKYFINLDLKSSGKCRLTKGRTLPNMFVTYQFGYPKGSPYAEFIDFVLLRAVECGIRDYMMKTYFPPIEQCRTDVKPKTRMRYLALEDLTFAFLIFAVGAAFSLAAFVVEISLWVAAQQKTKISVYPFTE